MKILLILAAIAVIAICISAYNLKRKIAIARTLTASAVPYSLKGPDHGGVSLLVLGDSTAVGVGAARPEETLAALVASHVKATSVENRAISGARVRDLSAQTTDLKRGGYTYILVGIGANDVIRFGNATETARHLQTLLQSLPPRQKLVVYMAGNVGATQIFPHIIRAEYTNRTMDFHDAFAQAVHEAGGVYVNLYMAPKDDPFSKDPSTYLAADGLHPTSAGYALWFEKIRTVL